MSNGSDHRVCWSDRQQSSPECGCFPSSFLAFLMYRRDCAWFLAERLLLSHMRISHSASLYSSVAERAPFSSEKTSHYGVLRYVVVVVVSWRVVSLISRICSHIFIESLNDTRAFKFVSITSERSVIELSAAIRWTRISLEYSESYSFGYIGILLARRFSC